MTACTWLWLGGKPLASLRLINACNGSPTRCCPDFKGRDGTSIAREAAKMTLRQLNRRCGPLSETTTAQIQGLPVEQLEALADALLDFQGPADLASWLAGNT
ncbi:DUF4351 domain-containing protein [Synechococcus sp. CBW1108]|uniref:DUF4351 domain-containing protein n=1 Tax=Synechococcus sp. CBW1108 TaxID=1353147 RepID=UPI0018CCE99B|nr:DUF4351 domain-containing protein [Synechococcus sp. CBW1108]QPN71494.1 DUF4351 domain-containing protein [Synechococcus sp. CBW1108]